MCTRFYLDSEAPELTPFVHAVAISPLSQKFINAGHPVLTSGEIHPTNVVPTVAWGRKGKSAVFPMQFGFHLSNSLLLNARSETAGEKTTFRDIKLTEGTVVLEQGDPHLPDSIKDALADALIQWLREAVSS